MKYSNETMNALSRSTFFFSYYKCSVAYILLHLCSVKNFRTRTVLVRYSKVVYSHIVLKKSSEKRPT